MRLVLFTLTVALFALAGCSSSENAQTSQFKTYSDFSPGPEGGVDLVWAREDIVTTQQLRDILSQYDSVVLDRVYVVVNETELNDNEIAELTEHLLTQLKSKLSDYKSIADKPSSTTLRVSIAISNVQTPNPILAVTSSVLPVGLGISTISKITTGEHTNVGKATIELLVSDSMTDEPIIAAIDSRTGNKDFTTMIDSLDDAKDAINWWVERLGDTLVAAGEER
ncbi:lipoprotein putative [Vibrio maritimus]|uniref:Lipoprotein putative n=1 Tax=Vibrio maritimus TaxID=990268 RepID=A0A090T2Y8_9VIBR|nr:lipoprotein putative [Vibrio maritimus]